MTRLIMLVVPIAGILCVPVGAQVCAVKPSAVAAEEKQMGFESLFNGHDFTGWQAGRGWGIDNGAICTDRGRQGGFDDLLRCDKKLTGNFDLRFEWKPISRKSLQIDGGFSLSDGVSSRTFVKEGASSTVYECWENLRFFAGGNAIIMETDKNIPIDASSARSRASLSYGHGLDREPRIKLGEWNQGQIVCTGPWIETWCNGENLIKINVDDLLKEHEGPKETKRLFTQWTEWKRRGLYLRFDRGGHAAQYRNIRIRRIEE